MLVEPELRLTESLGADMNADGRVDALDLRAVAQMVGTGDPTADLSGDGVVDQADLKLVIEQLGREARVLGTGE